MISLLRSIIVGIVSICTGGLVSTIIQRATPATTKKLTKLSMLIGGTVIGMMVGDKAAKYAEEQFDETVKSIKETDASLKALKK